MLDFVDARLEAFESFFFGQLEPLLQDNRPVVHFLVDEMDRHPRGLAAVGKGVFDRLDAFKRRQERGMDVEDLLRVFLEEKRRQQPHVSGQDDKIDSSFL